MGHCGTFWDIWLRNRWVFDPTATRVLGCQRTKCVLYIYMARCAPVRTGAQRATYERVFKRFESWNFDSKRRVFARFFERVFGPLSTCPLGPDYRQIGAQHF